MKSLLIAIATLGLLASPASAGKDNKTFVVVNEAVGVPVFPNDITDRPYEVLGEVKAEVRKATIFSKEASQEKIYRELWERGEKLGADAVVNTKYGDSRVTLMSWGSTAVTGTAIRFVAAPIAPPAPTADIVQTPIVEDTSTAQSTTEPTADASPVAAAEAGMANSPQ